MKSLEERSIYDLFFNSPDIVIVEGELEGQVREFRIYTREELRKLENPSIIEYAELKQKIEKLELIESERTYKRYINRWQTYDKIRKSK